MSKKNPLGALCEKVATIMSPTSLELINPVSHTLLELVLVSLLVHHPPLPLTPPW